MPLGPQMLTLTPTRAWKIGGPAFLLSMALLMMFLLGGNFTPASWRFQDWAVASLALLFLGSALEIPTKVVRLEGGTLKARDWFVWRERQLPPLVSVGRDFKGRVILIDARSGESLATVAREFGEAEKVENWLRSALRESGLLAPAA
jgi:hypothetical protein